MLTFGFNKKKKRGFMKQIYILYLKDQQILGFYILPSFTAPVLHSSLLYHVKFSLHFCRIPISVKKRGGGARLLELHCKANACFLGKRSGAKSRCRAAPWGRRSCLQTAGSVVREQRGSGLEPCQLLVMLGRTRA